MIWCAVGCEQFTSRQLVVCDCTHASGTNGSAPISMAGVKLKPLTAQLEAGSGSGSGSGSTSGEAKSASDQLSLVPITVYRRSTSHEFVNGVDSISSAADRKSVAPAPTGSGSGSGGGASTVNDSDIRSPSALALTVQHLTRCVLNRSGDRDQPLPFAAIYHFVSDRLRAVKKEVIITQLTQSSNATDRLMAIDWLQRMIRFYVLGADVLMADPIASAGGAGPFTFDATLNDSLLTDSLLSLLEAYRFHAAAIKAANGGATQTAVDTKQSAADPLRFAAQFSTCSPAFIPGAARFSSLSTLHSPCDSDSYAILLRLNESNMTELQPFLSSEYVASPYTKTALSLWTAFHTNNYVRFFQTVKRFAVSSGSGGDSGSGGSGGSSAFDRVASAILKRYFWDVRVNALKAIVRAYQTPFLLSDLCPTLGFESVAEAHDFVIVNGLTIVDASPPSATKPTATPSGSGGAGKPIAVPAIQMKGAAITKPSADSMQLYRLKQQIRLQTVSAAAVDSKDSAPAKTESGGGGSSVQTFIHPLSIWIAGETN